MKRGVGRRRRISGAAFALMALAHVLPASSQSQQGGADAEAAREIFELTARLPTQSPEATIPALLAAMGRPNATVRIWAAGTLGGILDSLDTDSAYAVSIPDVIPKLIAALKDKDAAVRKMAAYDLKALRSSAVDAIPALIAELKDPDANVRNMAAQAIGQISSNRPDVAAALAATLKDRDAGVRSWAAYDLRAMRDRSTIPALLADLKDPDDNVRGLVADALVQIGVEQNAKEAIPALVPAMHDQSPTVRARAVTALGRIGPKAQQTIPALLAASKDSNASVRGQAAIALAKIGPNALEALQGVVAGTKDPNVAVRINAVSALAQIDPQVKEAIPALLGALSDPDKRERLAAARLLSSMGPKAKATAPSLSAALHDTEAEVRRAAAEALSQIEPDESAAIPALLAVIKDRDPGVRAAAFSALGQFGADNSEVTGVLASGLNDKSVNVRIAAAQSLGEAGAEAAIPTLRAALQADPDPTVRRDAAIALGQIGPDAKVASPVLLAALKDESPYIREDAAKALASIGLDAEDAAAIPALEAALKDPDDEVRAYATLALGQIGPAAKETVPALLAALKAKDYDNFRNAAAQALGGIVGGPGADTKAVISALTVALRDPDVRTQNSAADALVNIADNAVASARTDVIGQLEQVREAMKAKTFAFSRRQMQIRLNELRRMQPPQPGWFAVLYAKHPGYVLIVAFYVVDFVLCGVLLYARPLWLWQFNQLPVFSRNVQLAQIQGSLAHLFLVGFFQYHSRVLDAWVAKRLNTVRERFGAIDIVSKREFYVPEVPVKLDARLIPLGLTPEQLRKSFRAGSTCILICGEGGAGKSSLAFQISRWVMEDDSAKRPSQHQMLPVLIAEDLNPKTGSGKKLLTEAIRVRLKNLTDDKEAPSEQLVGELLKRKRILLVVDGLSEMNEATRKEVRTADAELDINAMVVTSRLMESLEKRSKTVVEPDRIERERLASFLQSYLILCGKTRLFNDNEFLSCQQRLKAIVRDREITVLLARIFLDHAIRSKEGWAGEGTPENIPGLMLEYLNHLNRQDPDRGRPERADSVVHAAAKTAAWECLRQSFQPRPARIAAVEAALGVDGEAMLEYLEEYLHVVVTLREERDQIRFALDPLAEYLAALRVVENCRGDDYAWRAWFDQADGMPGAPLAIMGFLRAVRDCCLWKRWEFGIPAFVIDELARLCGIVAEGAAGAVP